MTFISEAKLAFENITTISDRAKGTDILVKVNAIHATIRYHKEKNSKL